MAIKQKEQNKELPPIEILNKKKEKIALCYDNVAHKRDKWIKRNKYYYKLTKKIS